VFRFFSLAASIRLFELFVFELLAARFKAVFPLPVFNRITCFAVFCGLLLLHSLFCLTCYD